MPDAVVVVTGDRITAAGARASVTVPAGATVIDGTGQFVVPGFFDTNVHLSLYGGVNDRYETLVRYHSRQAEIVLEAAQLQLKHGVTTVRDSYGVLPALVETRERIAKGQAVGVSILAAGNIVGWGGPYSVSFSLIRGAGDDVDAGDCGRHSPLADIKNIRRIRVLMSNGAVVNRDSLPQVRVLSRAPTK